MYEQISQQFIQFTRAAADNALKAQQLASEAFTKSVELQLGLAEERIKANGEFAKQITEIRDLDGAKQFWPKGSELARENFEKFYGAGRELFELGLNTCRECGELFQNSVETAKAQAEKAQAKATKSTKAA